MRMLLMIRPRFFFRSDEHTVTAHSRYRKNLSYLGCKIKRLNVK